MKDPETLSLIISGVSLLVAVAAFVYTAIIGHRTSVYQRFDYAARIDVLDEVIQVARLSGDQLHVASWGSGTKGGDTPILVKLEGFGYRASLCNQGDKPIPISGVYLDYGDITHKTKHMKHSLQGEFYLTPTEPREIRFTLPRSQIEKTKHDLGIQHCLFQLRVIYKRPNGKNSKYIRGLGGFEGAVYAVPKGDALT